VTILSRSKKTASTEQTRTRQRRKRSAAGLVPEASPTTPTQEPRFAEAERELIARKARKEDKKETSHKER
jgi:hypothetical protein